MQLVIYGEGELHGFLEDYILQKGLESKVSLKGFAKTYIRLWLNPICMYHPLIMKVYPIQCLKLWGLVYHVFVQIALSVVLRWLSAKARMVFDSCGRYERFV